MAVKLGEKVVADGKSGDRETVDTKTDDMGSAHLASADSKSKVQAGSYKLLLFLGMLWLLMAVGLLLYQLTDPSAVIVEWNTATEVSTAGFFLYRSDSPDSGFVQINQELIAAKGDSQSGATYSYTDKDVHPGETYYYLLEELEFDSTRSRYLDDIFSGSVPQTWWVIAISALSLVAGVALLVSGLRERRRIL